ncbi:hypothetical protein A7K94_0218590 [Modestobacter sp. VKM Ac-2676]|nr:hypothetical protein A7K94_0218590 [Modestobacter sp. VKM Ac-2676]
MSTDPQTPRTGGQQGYLRIATEEAFATQDLFDAWARTMDSRDVDPGFAGLAGFYTTSQAERRGPSSGGCSTSARSASRTWTPPASTGRCCC